MHQESAAKPLHQRLLAGEPAAAEELVTTEGGRLFQASRRILGNEEDALDCVQEAFAKAFQKISTFEGRSDISTWLYRILINESLIRLRQKRRSKIIDIDSLMPEFDIEGCRIEPPWQPVKDPEQLAESGEIRRHVRAAIDILPEDARNVLLLRDIEELNTRETAEILEISEAAVKVRLHRARAALKKLLEPHFGAGDVE